MKKDEFGWKILEIDLSEKVIKERILSQEMRRRYLGGRGLGARLLFDELEKEIEPFDPRNPLIFTTGPLAGTNAPMNGKTCVTSKSPLTGIYGMSLVGGYFGAELRLAGYMSIIVKGKSEDPVYLFLNRGNKVEFRSASKIWGMGTDEAQATIRRELEDNAIRIACIGPAGEHLVRIAGIISDKRAAGRCGLGAVMGSKNLKAIAVRKVKNGEISVADPLRFLQTIREAQKKLKDSGTMQTLTHLGTAGTVSVINEAGMLPTRNHQAGRFEDADKISGERLQKIFRIGRSNPCPKCPMPCSSIHRVLQGPYKGSETEGPEFETLYALGSNCHNSNLESIIHADMLCDRFGLDTMSTGSTIAFAMECYERGLIDKEVTEGVDLCFGNDKAIIDLIGKIAYKKGFGNLLSDGSVRASKSIPGSSKYAMHVKGLELGGYDPRGAKGAGLSFATCTRGGCHHAGGYTIFTELYGKGIDRFSIEGKASLVKELRDLRIIYDSATLCTFSSSALGLDIPLPLINSVTGFDLDLSSLIAIADKISDLERKINLREGMGPGDDTLPQRLLKEPMPDGPCKGEIVELGKMLKEYYKITGWDTLSGSSPDEA
jgi:aldehyde:ferredoxin oxidoreductase